MFAQQSENKSTLLFEQSKVAFDHANEEIMKRQMDKSHKDAVKMVVTTATGNYIKS